MSPSPQQTFQIAIDGPSGVGKSSTAQALAKKLNFTRIDSGTLYRALTYIILKKQPVITDEYMLQNTEYICNLSFDVCADRIVHDGLDIKKYLRHRDVDLFVSVVARQPFVREKIRVMQNALMESHGGVIIDGRDIGTVIMPDADVKVFLTAREDVRAQRRWIENNKVDEYEKVLNDMRRRDFEDINREFGPLKKAEDAVVVDNSDIGFDEQVEIIFKLVKEKRDGLN
ncbi:hypothetical protein COBT_003139 [Conglomerata obtusa]